MEHDRYGLALSTRSAAAAAYREGVDLMLSAWPGAEACFERALREDEGFALAHAALGRFHQMYARGAEARAAIARARETAKGASARERAHVEILGLAVEGASARALEALLRHIDEWPRDAFALALALGAFGLYAFGGRADHDAVRLALCERVSRHYPEDWWFSTFLGWAHTEAGSLAAGEEHTVRALELRPANAHAAHAMAHWYVESGQASKGALFVEGWLPAYAREGVLFSHLSWHCTLAFLEAREHRRALELHAGRIRPSATVAPPINRISDAASLLWRLSLAETVPAGAWQEVRAYVAATYPGPAHHFIEWHIAMVLAATRDAEALEARLASIREREASGALPTGGVLEAVCRGLAAFGRADHPLAAALLSQAAPGFVRLGGSGAQRRILADTLAAARSKLR